LAHAQGIVGQAVEIVLGLRIQLGCKIFKQQACITVHRSQRRAQIVECRSGVEHQQFPQGRSAQTRAEPTDRLSLKQRFRPPIGEGSDHAVNDNGVR
jgi:hypothetical protein